MKVIATGFGSPERLSEVPSTNAEPGDGEVAIAVRGAGVNPVDRKRYADPDYLASHGQKPATFPMDLGVEIAGVVTATGKGATGPAGPIVVGDEVIGFRISGGYADRIVTSADNVVPKPTGLSWERAASMMLVGTTAAHALAAVLARPGQTILVHGAAGGVGSAIVQLARVRGIRIIGTAGERDFAKLRGYGAQPVRYDDGLEARVRAEAGAGIDAAIDAVGTDEAIDVSLALVSDRHRIATIVAFDRARREGFQALGGAPGQDDDGIKVRLNARMELIGLVEAGAYEVDQPTTFPLTDAAVAHRRLDEGGAGRMVLVPGEP